MKRYALLIVGLCAATPAFAQKPDDSLAQMNKRAEEREQQIKQRSEAARAATKMTPVSKPLSQLLDDGWIITASGTSGVILSQGSKWISCTFELNVWAGKPYSDCWALN